MQVILTEDEYNNLKAKAERVTKEDKVLKLEAELAEYRRLVSSFTKGYKALKLQAEDMSMDFLCEGPKVILQYNLEDLPKFMQDDIKMRLNHGTK